MSPCDHENTCAKCGRPYPEFGYPGVGECDCLGREDQQAINGILWGIIAVAILAAIAIVISLLLS